MNLPNLIIAGVTKAGTTSLFEYLAQHPQVCPAQVKQTNYFKPLRDPGGVAAPLQTYAEYFSACGDQSYRMEASPSYFYSGKGVIAGIDETLPGARVVISLREPVSRLWSHYRMKQRDLGRNASVAEFSDYARRSIALRGERSGEELHERDRGAALVGFYVDYLAQWLDTFDDRLLVVFFEHLTADPRGVTEQVCRWLGVDPGVAASFDYGTRNVGADPRSRMLAAASYAAGRTGGKLFQRHPRLKGAARQLHDRVNRRAPQEAERLDPDLSRWLQEAYAPANAQLASELASRHYDDLPAWLQPAEARS